MATQVVTPVPIDILAGKVKDLNIKVEPLAIYLVKAANIIKLQRGREPSSADDCKRRLERSIKINGLEKFYPEVTTELAERGAKLVNQLIEKKKCTWEMAHQFLLLTLYDLAILIDDSDSMVYDQKGARIVTLQKILNSITGIYNLAREQGIMTVRFLNATKGKRNVTTKTVKTVIKGHDYGGITRIGTELKKKILDKFVLGMEMKKPLLIMVITDGGVEGESSNLLESVIKNCIFELTKSDGVAKGPSSVAFQFSRVGDDEGALDLLKGLDDDKEVGRYIDCFLGLEEIVENPENKWNLLSKLLLGAISSVWDEASEKVEKGTKVELAAQKEADDSDEEDEEGEEIDDDDELGNEIKNKASNDKASNDDDGGNDSDGGDDSDASD